MQEMRPPSTGPSADVARAQFRGILDEKGHAVDIARRAMARLEAALADGSLHRTTALEAMLADLSSALDTGEGDKLGGKSAEAARFILRAISRELDRA
jgi:hypothetical protein